MHLRKLILEILQHPLDAHDTIAWDVDNTLVNHPKSREMHKYILDNPHKTHHIVSFRSHGMQDNILSDIRRYGSGLNGNHFKSIVNLPNHVYENAKTRGTPEDIHAYHHWKGKVCKTLGATALVDDDIAKTEVGCVANGIALMHPDNF